MTKISSKSIGNHWFSSKNATHPDCEPSYEASKLCDFTGNCFNAALFTWALCFFKPQIKILICLGAYSKTNDKAVPQESSKYHQNPLKIIEIVGTAGQLLRDFGPKTGWIAKWWFYNVWLVQNAIFGA